MILLVFEPVNRPSRVCPQLAAVLDGVLSKLSRYDEGTFFSSILSLTVSIPVVRRARLETAVPSAADSLSRKPY